MIRNNIDQFDVIVSNTTEYNANISSNPSSSCFSLSIVHQNIRSMRSNFDVLCAHLDTMGLPQIIILSEIWIEDNELQNFSIDNYSIFAKCNNSYRAGGVAAFVNNNLHCSASKPEFHTADCLLLCLAIGALEVHILCIYKFVSSNNNDFIFELCTFLQHKRFPNMLIIGDVNIDILNLPASSDEYMTMLAEHGFEALVNEPTRISDISVTCIDHVFCKLSNYDRFNVNSFVSHLNITDHSATYISLEYSSEKCAEVSNLVIYKSINYDCLRTSLKNETWQDVYIINNASVAFDAFVELLKSYIVRHTTQMQPKKQEYKHLKPWITDYICRKIEHKNKLYTKTLRHPNDIQLKANYIKIKKNVENMIKERKNIYYKRKFDKCVGNPKAQWRVIDEITGRKCVPVSVKSLKSSNDILLTDSYDISNEFNKYFIEIPHKVNMVPNQNIHQGNTTLFLEKTACNTFFFQPVTPNEVLITISSLKNSSSAGIDGISSLILKKISLEICDILSHLINISFEQGIFPEALKTAIVVPLHKKGCRSDPNNYRPISILSSFSKIYEKVIASRIISFLNLSNFFSDSQFGFRKTRSTEDALLNFLNEVYSKLDENCKVVGLFIDLTKAFDLVDHDVLSKKLRNAGFRGSMDLWFNSYLKNRSQLVRCDNKNSDILTILNKGVPQGSVLGPLMFLIYINSLCNFNFIGKRFAFADDVSFVYSASTVEQIKEEVNKDLSVLNKWLEMHGMILSSKTKLIFFSLTGPLKSIDVQYHRCKDSSSCGNHCFPIENVAELKYLGLTLDYKLKWNSHVSKLKQLLYTSLRKFYLIRSTCPKYILNLLYFSLVQSRLEYGLSCYGSTYMTHIKPLLLVQKAIIRVIAGKNKTHSALPIFRSSNIFPLRYLYFYKVLKIFFVRSNSFSFKDSNGYALRRQHICSVPKVKTENARRFYSNIAPYIFNKLPDNLRITKNLKTFLNEVKKWLLEQNDVELLFDVVA